MRLPKFFNPCMASAETAGAAGLPSIPIEPDKSLESPSYKRWSLVRAYGFAVGGYNFMLSPGIYSELIKDPRWSPLPNVGQHFAGLLNVRGNLVPVYHLTTFLDASQPLWQPPFALLIGAPGQGAAVLLDAKPQAFDYANLTASDDSGRAPKALAYCVKNTFRIFGDIWFEISHEALFSTMAG